MSRQSVCPHGTTRLTLDGFSWNLILYFENLSWKLKFHYKLRKINGTLQEDQHTFFFYLSRSILLRMRNVSDRNCRENQNAHFVSSNFFFSFEYRAVDDVMWKNSEEPGRPQTTIWHMRIERRITKATNTHSEYVIIIAFPLQKRLHERVPMLRHTHIACLI